MSRHERRKEKRKTHKAQHYVAKGYMRAWCDPSKEKHESPYVWVFDRDGPSVDKPAKRKAPVNIFWEPEMYTITPPDDPTGRDLTLEHALNRLETSFCAVRRDFIEPARPLGPNERTILLAFLAASQFRTPGNREHTRQQWQPVLEKGRAMEAWARNATPEQRANAARIPSLGSRGKGMTMDEVRAMVEKPLQTLLAVQVNTLVPLLHKMTNLSVVCTDKTPGFITSDEPVVWHDPASYKRAPLYRAPALMYDTVEITMPISPTRMLFLGRRNGEWGEYLDLDSLDFDNLLLDEFNRRTCRFSR